MFYGREIVAHTVLEVEKVMIRLRELVMRVTKRIGAIAKRGIADDVESHFAHCTR